MSLPGRWDAGDPEVDAFVDANLLSFASWDLIIYLARNAGGAESLSQLAAVLARHDTDLIPAIDVLVANGVIEVVRGDPDAYALTTDPASRELVERFIEMAAKREHRLEFVRRVLGHMSSH
jgi:DNA-binding MarR family transcriptional regulator